MDEKEILQRQVDALEKLLSIKDAVIGAQDEKIRKLENKPYVSPYQPVYTPPTYGPKFTYSNTCPVDGGAHEYENPFFSINPQPCKKCGHTDSSYYRMSGGGGSAGGAGGGSTT